MEVLFPGVNGLLVALVQGNFSSPENSLSSQAIEDSFFRREME